MGDQMNQVRDAEHVNLAINLDKKRILSASSKAFDLMKHSCRKKSALVHKTKIIAQIVDEVA